MTARELYATEKKRLLDGSRFINLQVGDNDLIGNKFNGHNLHLLLQEHNIKAYHYVTYRHSEDPNTIVFPPAADRNYAEQIVRGKEYLLSDIVHLHLIHNTDFDLNYLPVMTRMKPVILTLHDPFFFGGHCIHSIECEKWKTFCSDCPHLDTPFSIQEDISTFLFERKRLAIQNSELSVIVASDWMEERVKQSPVFAGKKVYKQPFGINQTIFCPGSKAVAREALGIDQAWLVLMFRADQNPFKGLQTILDAVRRLKTTQTVVLLTISEKGLIPDDIADRYIVQEYGWLTDDKKLAQLYQACDLFLMPSKQETFGMMAIEAMSCGKTVLATLDTSLAGVIHAPDCGFAVEEEEFAGVLQLLVDNPQMREDHDESSLDYAREHYSETNYVQGIIRIYEDTMRHFSGNEACLAAVTQLYGAYHSKPILANNEIKSETVAQVVLQPIDSPESVPAEPMTSIPKVIHYCWFGGNPLPESAKKYIESWKMYCPDYQIIEWNESNFDISMHPFVSSAFRNKKWTFIADYARLYIIYNYGGIYLDTDVEIIRSIDDLLQYTAFMGFEGNEFIAAGLGFGATKKCPVIKDMLDMYDNIEFEQFKDKLAEIASPQLTTHLLLGKGLVQNGERQCIEGLELFPEDYFCPKNPITRFLNITKNTYSIHFYDASWVDKKEKEFISSLDYKASQLMQSQSKKVSILIPVYNGHKYIRQAIDSALNQSYVNKEVIVINDGSIDDTDEIARSYGSRIRYFKKDNGGVSTALNIGLSVMRGHYVAWLSHDDVYHLEKLERQVAYASLFDDNTITISNWSIIDAIGGHVKDQYLDPALEITPKAFLAFDRKTWLNGCAMLIPRSVFDEIGFFNESLKSTQDYDMWLRLMDKVRFKIFQDHLLFSRAHAEQGSLSMINALKDSDLIHEKIVKELTQKELDEYFGKKPSKYLDVYHSFVYCGYKRTPALILEELINYYISQDEIKDACRILEEELLGVGSPSFFSMRVTLDLLKSKKKKKRLLFFTAHWYTGGVERFLSNLMRPLTEQYDVIVVSVDSNNEGSIPLPHEVFSIKVSNERFVKEYDYVVYALCTILQVDIAIGCINLFEKVLNFYELAEGASFKTIASNHEFYFYPHENEHLYPLAQRRIQSYRNIDAAVWLTNYSTYVYNQFNQNGVLIANPNTYPIQIPVEKNTQDNGKVILCVGRFNDYVKRVDRILRCFQLVLKKMPDTELVLVGKCDLNILFMPHDSKSINDLIAELRLPRDQIHVEGEVNNIERYYSIADVLLLTSDSEGFPMVINEAACFSVPTVCNYIAGLEDIIVDGENGYMVPQDDIFCLADRVCRILDDEERRLKMGLSARQLATRFDIESIVEKWKRLFQIVLQKDSTREKNTKLQKYLGYDCCKTDMYIHNLVKELDVIMHKAYNSKTRYSETMLTSVVANEKHESVAITQEVAYQTLYQSDSWQLTKPIRAFQNARRFEKGIVRRFRYYCCYMKDAQQDNQSDAEILRSHCWRITAPLRKITRPFKKTR